MKYLLLFFLTTHLVFANDFPNGRSPHDPYDRDSNPYTPNADRNLGKGSNWGMGWNMRQCTNHCDPQDPCCSEQCRHDECKSENGGLAHCFSTLSILNACTTANLYWDDSHSVSRTANGSYEGNIVVKVDALADSIMSVADAVSGAVREEEKIEYFLKANQGIFIDSGLHSIKFELNDSLQKGRGFRYKVYDCDDKSIVNKEYETFTLSKISKLGKDGIETGVVLREIKVPFRCSPNYFIITTTLRETSTGESDRGPNAMLAGPRVLTSKSNNELVSKQFMHVDSANAVVTLLPLKDEATSSHNESFYQFNHESCSYEQQTSSSTGKHLNDSLAVLKHHTIGLVDDDKAIIEFGIKRRFKNKLIVNWKTLQTSGSWSKQYSEHKDFNDDDDMDIPDEVKKIQDIIVGGIAAGAKEQKKLSELIIQTLPLGEKDKCQVKGVNDLFEGGVGGQGYKRVDDVDYSISISPATQSEIESFHSAKDGGHLRSHHASIPPVEKISNYKKEPSSIFAALQSSAYNNLSKSEKKAWDKTAESQQDKIDSKKAEAEFESTSLDDLEMFTE